MIHLRWLKRFVATLAGLLILALAINLLIDPYGVYRVVAVEGVNANKHLGTDHIRETNHYLAIERGARSLAMGNSRVAIAIDPRHPGWGEAQGPVHNLSLPGAAIDELEVYLRTVLKRQPLKKVVIGLDLLMFNSTGYRREDSYKSKEDSPWDFHKNLLLSVHTLKDSFNTLRKQNNFKYPDYRADGMMSESFMANRVARDGYLKTFHRAETNYLQFRPEFHATNPDNGASRYDSLREIIRLSRQHDFELVLFISPMHARYLELLDFSGLSDDTEEWIRTLLHIVQEDAALHPGQRPVELWDFSGYNSITTERVPPPDDVKTVMTYYWETSHYKNAAGDLVLDRLLNYVAPNRNLPEDFGVKLDPEKVEDHLSRMRGQREAYRRQNPLEIEDLNRLRSKYWESRPL